MGNDGGGTQAVGNDKDIYNLMLLVGAAVALLLYSKLLQNRLYWIRMEMALGVLYTLLLPLCRTALSYFVEEKERDVSVYLCRLLLVSLVAQAAASYFTQDCLDPTVPIAVSISNTLVRGPLILVCIGMADAAKTNKGLLYIGAFASLLLLVGDLYHLANSKTRSYSHHTVGDPVSFHLSVDGILSFLLGSLVLGFPDMFLSLVAPTVAVKPVYLILLKGFGIMLVGGALLSFASLAYRDDEDAVSMLKTRLVVYLACSLLAVTSIFVNSNFRTFGHCGIMLGVMGCLALNAGFMTHKHEKEN